MLETLDQTNTIKKDTATFIQEGRQTAISVDNRRVHRLKT